MNISTEAIVNTVVNKLLYKYSGYPLERDDLISQSNLIVAERIHKFNPRYGATLSTYLYNQIYWRLSNYIVDQVKHYGNEELTRVPEDALEYELAGTYEMKLNEFRLSLEAENEKIIFDYIRQGYTYRDISESVGISTGSITNMVKRWANEVQGEEV